MLDEDGKKVPGAYKCREHAQTVIDEYSQKIDLHWSLVEIDEFGNPKQ